jgi:superfamily II DNA or RNA helicase
MVTYVGSTIRVVEPSEELVRWCKDHLTLPNPDYYKKERMGLWVGKTPKTISLWRMGNLHRMVRNELYPLPILEMPFGVFRDVYHFMDNVQVTFLEAEHVEYGDPIPLYDYQADAVQAAFRKRYGILQAPAGCGKTQMGLALIQRYGVKALWLTHTKDLLNQSKERAERYMDKSLMGTITEGKVDIGKGITFATVQTMSKMNLREYRDTWGVIICDECHRVCCSATGVAMFEKVLNELSCGHKYGLSATVHRADGLIRATFALIGRVVYTVPETAVEALVEPVSVETVQTYAEFPEDAVKDDGSIVWAKLINGLCADRERNRLIGEKLRENKEYSCLILSDRLAHLEALMTELPVEMMDKAVMISGRMTSKKGKAEREAAIEQMRTGEKKYLFATYTLAKEGLDVPRLERLFLTTPQKDEAIIIQSLGRIARKFAGKAKPVCVDFVDGKIGMMVGMWKKRMRIYRAKGVEM